jgi:hypothetical protein
MHLHTCARWVYKAQDKRGACSGHLWRTGAIDYTPFLMECCDMPDSSAPTDGPAIGLAEMIASLRHELRTALETGKDQTVSFDVDKIELELKVAVSRKAKGEGGVAFWVLKAGANVEAGRDTSHNFKLILSPVLSATAARLRVGSTTKQGPARD